ncbi:SOD1 [Lepeophtheirus salmonis]|uniref:SOD1 n=1 Tax=Lepeophtheirus salmonis TaxID=72036 RepID=A0A7R8H9J0_LEPSM|nr:SOD1 [Lepeophtheirus salmonis]CAF2955806.1 SOD1 [Lepeophtheirus salmonis]
MKGIYEATPDVVDKPKIWKLEGLFDGLLRFHIPDLGENTNGYTSAVPHFNLDNAGRKGQQKGKDGVSNMNAKDIFSSLCGSSGILWENHGHPCGLGVSLQRREFVE